MLIGAGLNDFGLVGLFPAVRVVSVRATIPGSDRVIVPGYVNAIKSCNGMPESRGLRVIELAPTLSGPVSPEYAGHLAGAIATARMNGLSVVAAAGDNDGGPAGTPAGLPGVLLVGGSAADGHRCEESAAGAVLQGPGCGLEDADPVSGQLRSGWSGTSPASALVAAALAALRSWRPELSPTEAEQALVESVQAAPGGPLLDVAAAFRRLGLGAVVDANQPAPSAAATSLAPSSAGLRPGAHARLPRPRVRVRAIRRYRGVLVSARNRRRGMVTSVSAHRLDEAVGRLRQVASRARRSRHVALRVTAWDELRVRFRDAENARTTGPVTIVAHPRHRRLG